MIATEKEVTEFIETAINSGLKGSLLLAEISSKEQQDIFKQTGIDTTDFTHILEADRVRHIMKEHGSAEKENPRGNIAVTAEDFLLLPEIFEKYDSIQRVEQSYFGKERIMYRKMMHGTVYCVVEVRGKKQVLSLITLYKIKKEENDDSSD